MKKILLLLLLSPSFSQAQFFMTLNGFYSQPLGNFEKDDYSDGLGLELGFNYQFTLSDPWRLELNSHWQWGSNGTKRNETDLARHRLENGFSNWHGEVKLMYDTEKWAPYVGIHLGSGRYKTNEVINYIVTSTDDDFAKNTIHNRSLFQFGFSLGSYLKLTENSYMDFGLSTNFGDQGVNFFNINSYSFTNNQIQYTSTRSRPALLLVNVGFIFKLRKLEASEGSTENRSDHPSQFPKTKPTTIEKKDPHSR